jgi:EpsI family protein
MKTHLSFAIMLLFLVCAAAAAWHLTLAGERERVPSRASLSEFPQQIGVWHQEDAQILTAGESRELKADDFISRTYRDDKGFPVFLSIAYYLSQRHRQTIHSPQNCLPGAGWIMGSHRVHQLNQSAPDQKINEYLIEKDGVKMLAFYWYHGRGRTVASEYSARFYTIEDAVFRRRTDGALVRVIVPMSKGDGAEEHARGIGLEFSRRLLPLLPGYVPD